MTHLAKVFSAEVEGIDARAIEVETDVHAGLHSFTIVGLADKALSEAKERVNAALKNSGVKPPAQENRRIVVNLAPADVKKTGSHYDLAIALGYLVATGQASPGPLAGKLFAGELALDGAARPIRGALSIARFAAQSGFRTLFVPEGNADEAALIGGIEIIPVRTLSGLVAHLEGKVPIAPQPKTAVSRAGEEPLLDIGDVKGQENAKRALLIAAAGGHNILFVGPPGTGKTMLAQALTSLLPPPEAEEIIETTQIWSVAGLLGKRPFLSSRPFRAPHHTASPPAVVGGGTHPRPGEVSLAHRGVLFLDEFPEFRRDILEALREPLESGRVAIARAKGSLILPARFSLVAAMNPCPCGYYGDPEKECRCAAYEVLRYQKKISGPLLDRIDIQVSVPRIPIKTLTEKTARGGESARLKDLVSRARVAQRERLAGSGKFTNAEMSAKECEEFIRLGADAEDFLKTAVARSFISPRGYFRLLKTARTIADLRGSETVERGDLAEAFSFRLRESAE